MPTGCANKNNRIESSAYLQWQFKIKPNFRIFYMSVGTTYPENFITKTILICFSICNDSNFLIVHVNIKSRPEYA